MILGYEKNFWVLALSMFFFMTSFNLLIPELNTVISSYGGEEFKGYIFILFSIAAGLSRPFSGKLSDTIGRKKVMYIGVVLAALSCLLYSVMTSVFLFLSLRLYHGFSAGFQPTGATAMVTDILPPNKRGQGMGIWGVFISLGFGVGQAVGSSIASAGGIEILYISAMLTTLIAGVMLVSVKETLPKSQKVKFHLGLLKINFKDIFEPSVLPAAMVMVLSAGCSGAVFVLTPDLAAFLGLDKGSYFVYYALTTIVVRLLAGSLSDKIGRRKTLVIGFSILVASMLLTSLAVNESIFISAALLFGVATGISSPTIMAWMGDLADEKRRGAGSGTIFIALEIGIIIGSGITLLTYHNTLESISYSFQIISLLALSSVIYLIWHLLRRNSLT